MRRGGGLLIWDERWEKQRPGLLVLVVGGETEMTFFFPFASPVETLHRVKDNYADPTKIA
jgi:hypothetical protein